MVSLWQGGGQRFTWEDGRGPCDCSVYSLLDEEDQRECAARTEIGLACAKLQHRLKHVDGSA